MVVFQQSSRGENTILDILPSSEGEAVSSHHIITQLFLDVVAKRHSVADQPEIDDTLYLFLIVSLIFTFVIKAVQIYTFCLDGKFSSCTCCTQCVAILHVNCHNLDPPYMCICLVVYMHTNVCTSPYPETLDFYSALTKMKFALSCIKKLDPNLF